MPSSSTRAGLATAAWEYNRQLLGEEAAQAYLTSRHITKEAIAEFRLGYVGNPLSGDTDYQGRLSIPYLTPGGAVSIRFRNIGDGAGPKYLSHHGEVGRPYNVAALFGSKQPTYITEGEIDAISMWRAGLNAVGFPGAQIWKPVFARLFRMRDVVIVADGDDAGMSFAHSVAKDLESYRIVQCPPDQDANSILISEGPEGLRRLVGAKDDAARD